MARLTTKSATSRNSLRIKDAVIFAVCDGERIVGCDTSSALGGNDEQVTAWLAAAGYDIDRFFYFRGMVLLAEYRGHGIGRTFCDHREAYVRSRGYSHSAFCSVIRPANHPLKPANYWPLDGFWLKRGYRKVEHLVVSVAWKDVDEDQETEHSMLFWMREL